MRRVVNTPDAYRSKSPLVQAVVERGFVFVSGMPPVDARGRIVVLVDDGLATGASMRAAVAAVRQQDPAGIIVAVPVAAEETWRDLESEVEQVICLETPDPFYAVGLYYRHFAQVTDEAVRDLLRQAAEDWSVPTADLPRGPNGA